MAGNLITRHKINPFRDTKGFRNIVIEQWERAILAYNVEFRGGFYTNTQTPNGETKEIYVPDTREVFCNSIEATAIIILPRMKEKCLEAYNKVQEELEQLEKNFLDATTADENIVLGESFYEKEEDKILLEEYKNTRVKIYVKLFKALSDEITTRRYFASTSGDD